MVGSSILFLRGESEALVEEASISLCDYSNYFLFSFILTIKPKTAPIEMKTIRVIMKTMHLVVESKPIARVRRESERNAQTKAPPLSIPVI